MSLPTARSAVMIAGTLAVLPRAAAQPADPAAAVSADPASEVAAARRLLAAGDRAGAAERLLRVLVEHPDSPAAGEARAVARELLAARTEAPAGDPWAERPTGLARAELAIVQTLHGVVLGMETCAMLDCDDARPIGAALLIGGGAGLAGSLYGTRGGITPGRTLAINAGTFWGAWNGIALSVIADLDEPDEVAGTLAGLQAAGTAAGAAAAGLLSPTAGQVSLASSLGIWSGVVSGLTLMAAAGEDGVKEETFMATTLAFSDTGLAAGAYLARTARVSRARMLVIDAGGAAGVAAGMGLMLLAAGEDAEERAMFAAGAAGALAGLGVATWATSGWDAPEAPPVHAALLPARGGGVLALGGSW